MELAVNIALGLLGRLPLGVLRWIGARVGTVVYYLARRGRGVALDNLDLAYGDSLSGKEKRRIAKKSYVNLMTVALEMSYSKRLPNPIERVVNPHHKRLCFEAHDKGKGVILIVPHMGNWEISGRWLAENLPAVHALVRRQKPEWMDRILSEIRTRIGVRTIDNRDGLRPVLSALRRGELVVMMIDQHIRRGAVAVDFFGRKAMTSAAPALLAVKTGCAVLVGSCFRDPKGDWDCGFYGPVEIVETGDRDSDRVVNTQRIVDEIERRVREHPDDWMWMHRRWRKIRTPKPK